MDPVSQGAVGAALAASARWRRRNPVSPEPRGRGSLAAALGIGALAGMAPDLDVLIRSADDPLLFLDYHRQFTHALAFVPVGALACALGFHPLVRRRLTFGWTYLYCLLGFATHGLLDACTSYGTRLLWPFSEVRVAWNVIAVVDPLFTVPLLALLVAALSRGRAGFAVVALAWAALYLGLGAWQGVRAERAAWAVADARGHHPERLMVKPSFGNLLVWKTVYQADGRYHVDAVRPAARTTWFPGASAPVLDERSLRVRLPEGSRQALDLDRFRRFSDGWLAPAPERAGAVIDVRYSMLPNEIDPLWGIQLDPGRPDNHVTFFTARSTSPAQRRALWAMISQPGRPLPAASRTAWPDPG